MIILELLIYLIIFTLLVRISVFGGATSALYFYPVSYQTIAYERGIANKEEIQKKRKRFMIPFITIMFISLIVIIGFINKTTDFISAYKQSLLFLEVMNWYDGIVIDRLWVGHSKFWMIKGMEDVPYIPGIHDVKVKRGILTLIFAFLSVIPAFIIYLLSYII